ncbi:MAG: response regulator [Lachnospiraceae bacterium]|nr:response regulator [Lachnospiraceae bacterium]
MKKFQSKYFSRDLDIELRVFNITHILMGFSTLIFILLVFLVVDNDRTIGMIFCVGAFSFFTFYEANRTRHYVACAIAMSCVMNLVMLPIIYFSYNKQLCTIAIYFLFGLIYNNLVIPKKYSTPISVIDVLAYLLVIYAGNRYLEYGPASATTDFAKSGDYIIALIASGFVVLVSGFVIRYKKRLLNNEINNFNRLYEDVIEAGKVQDTFLVNMSHEIRTPMNSIMGNTQLLLDKELDDEVKNNLYGIYNSCNVLLSLTNEIMDLSKTNESEIVLYNSRYDIGELLTEIVSMISVRLTDSDVEFIVKIESDIPRYLYSDSGKLRQVFINILNNAIKNTDKGSITMSVGCEYKRNNEINLLFDVTDTGKGIDKTDLDELSGIVEEAKDDKRYKDSVSMEYAGISLTLCKDILDKLDGIIKVNSEYGDGTTVFTSIPQQIDSTEKVVEIREPEKINVLIYENGIQKSMHLDGIIKSLRLKSYVASTNSVFLSEIRSDDYTHVFISNENYIENIDAIKKNTGRKELIVISDISELPSLNDNIHALMRPVQLINVSALLNGETDALTRNKAEDKKVIMPQANVLVVDDNLTNLMVAANLLKKYRISVTTALSGKEALALIRENDYDLIFLDYMMPDMDGVDTLYAIRMLPDLKYREVPVIALTANVVSGAREMFFRNGFDDFIAKPIDINILENCLKNFIPKEMQEAV